MQSRPQSCRLSMNSAVANAPHATLVVLFWYGSSRAAIARIFGEVGQQII
jgi:hypothetical protein